MFIYSSRKKNLDAIAESEMNVFSKINVLHPILYVKQRSLMKQTMNVKDISVLPKHHSKEDSGIILENSYIKRRRSALNFQSIFGL